MCEGAIHFLLIVLMLRHLTCHTLFQMERRQLSPKYLPAASTKTACCCLLRREVINLEKFRLLCAVKPSSAHTPPNFPPQSFPKQLLRRCKLLEVASPWRNGSGHSKILSSASWAAAVLCFQLDTVQIGKTTKVYLHFIAKMPTLSWIFIHVTALLLEDCHSLVNIHIIAFKISLKPFLPRRLLSYWRHQATRSYQAMSGALNYGFFFLLCCSDTLN